MKFKCRNCQRNFKENEIFTVDDKHICAYCLYGKTKPLKIYPIGIVKNDLALNGTDFGTSGKKDISCIELLPSQKPFLYKLEDEKYITVVYYLHKSDKVKSVFCRGLDGKKVGVFASRTPHRLSKIAIQDVKLIKVERAKIYVEGLDAVNGSPVIDIKMKWDAQK